MLHERTVDLLNFMPVKALSILTFLIVSLCRQMPPSKQVASLARSYEAGSCTIAICVKRAFKSYVFCYTLVFHPKSLKKRGL